MSSMVPSRLTVIGSGILADDASERLRRCLDESERLFCIEPLAHFRQRHPAHGYKCRSFDPVFDELGDNRPRALERIAELLIEECRMVAAAALVLGGHPCLGVKPVQHLRALRPPWLAVEIVPGVSSLDWMMADLGLDAAEIGLQVISGSRSAALCANLPAAILSPGYARSVAPADRLAVLAALAHDLVLCYGTSAEFLVYSREAEGCQIDRLAVCDLVGLAYERRLGEKLLVGPVSHLPRGAGIPP